MLLALTTRGAALLPLARVPSRRTLFVHTVGYILWFKGKTTLFVGLIATQRFLR